MGAALEQLQARSAAEACAHCELETDVTEWLNAEPDAAVFLQQLLDAGAGQDAVRFLSQAIEPREAVWWAWDTAGSLAGDGDAPKLTDALAATSTWLTDPCEENRRAAHAAAEACGLDDSAGCAALAAFFAEDSIAPVEVEQGIPSPPGVCGKLAAGAILLAALRDVEHADERAAGYVARWFELAELERPWAAAPIEDQQAPGSDAPSPSPAKPDAAKPPPMPDDSGYNTDLKF